MNLIRLTVLCLTVFVGGCTTVGPNYTPPPLQTPAEWKEAVGIPNAAPGLEQKAWWMDLNDPVLDELMEKAEKSNLNIEQARLRIVQARAEFKGTEAGNKPKLNGAASISRSKESENTAGTGTGGDTSTIYRPGFDATWEIDVFGGVRRSLEAANARMEASVEDLHDTQLTLLGDVASYYVQLRASQQQLAITRRNLAAQAETADVTRERFRSGLTTYLDVAKAEAQKTTTAADIPSYESTIKKSIHRLSILTGQAPGSLNEQLDKALAFPSCNGIVAVGLPSELLTRRPDLRRAERKLAAASADIGIATADLYPKFDLTLGLGLNSNTASRLTSLSSGYWSLAPEVSALLFDGGKTRASIDGKQAVYDEILAAYKSAFLSALEDVENALSSYAAEQTKRHTLAESVRANKESVALAEECYRKGLTNFLDVLDAQRSLYSAQINLSKSDADVLTYFISLNKALGGGWRATDSRITKR
jgi:outer membrane protein, multidrug efflux system